VKFNRRFEGKNSLQRRGLLGICFMLVACLAYFWALKTKAIFSFETSLEFYGTRRRHIPKDADSHSFRCEKLRFTTMPVSYRQGGRAIAQAVSRRLPTAAVRGSKPDLGIWDFVMDKSGPGTGFLRELRFPLPIYIPSALHNHLHYHPRLAQ
jgi:hypothetical protein